MDMLSAEFVSFLRAAKLSTYARQGDDATVAPLLPDSKQLEHSDGRYLYRDVYVGLLHFVGQEIVYVDGRAVWSMAYSGGLLPGATRSEASRIYRALRAALTASPHEMPLRGPGLFETEGLRYTCTPSGELRRFRGDERIESEGRRLYELSFAGGALG